MLHYACRVVADSAYMHNGVLYRLTTMVVKLPRIVLAELNTHRVFSRNSASSRAIPTRKQLRALVRAAFVPSSFGTAVGGMNAGPALEGELLETAIAVWGDALYSQMWYALCLTTSPDYVEREWEQWVLEENDDFGAFVMDVAARIEDKTNPIHNEQLLWTTKGLTNRLLEPFMMHEVIITSTEWENFFNLRTDENAQEEIRTAAVMMKEAYDSSVPEVLSEGEWHLPFIQPEEKEWAKQNPELAVKAVTARCARVSYLTHDTGKLDLNADYRLADSLGENGHRSPFEHAGEPFGAAEWSLREDGIAALVNSPYATQVPDYVLKQTTKSLEFAGNFRGWGQARRRLPSEDVFQPQQETAA